MPENVKQTSFGSKIRELRKKKGLTQKAVVSEVLREDGKAIAQQYLNDLEHGRRDPPKPHIIEQLARVLTVRPEYLYFLASEIPSEWSKIPCDEDTIVAVYEYMLERIKEAANNTQIASG
jgi:transcriptional regulator with XRE-family HTH domain